MRLLPNGHHILHYIWYYDAAGLDRRWLQKYKSGIPLVLSSSAAISAACHAPESDIDAELLLVKWGVVGEADAEGVGHCFFTS